MDNNEYNILFSDITMLESNGEFSNVTDLMEQEIPKGHIWMIETKVTIQTSVGEGNFVLHLWNDGRIVITEYQPSIPDVFYNTDIQCLVMWASDAGWKPPSPAPVLIQDDIEFWKHFWETGLVQSEWLAKRFSHNKIQTDK